MAFLLSILISMIVIYFVFDHYYSIYKNKILTGKVAYILEEYTGSTIKGFVSEPYYNVSYEHFLHVKKILNDLDISFYYLNEFNHKRVKNKSLKFCEKNNWIDNETKELLDKKLNTFGYYKENKFEFHNRAQKEAFLRNKSFNQFTF